MSTWPTQIHEVLYDLLRLYFRQVYIYRLTLSLCLCDQCLPYVPLSEHDGCLYIVPVLLKIWVDTI